MKSQWEVLGQMIARRWAVKNLREMAFEPSADPGETPHPSADAFGEELARIADEIEKTIPLQFRKMILEEEIAILTAEMNRIETN